MVVVVVVVVGAVFVAVAVIVAADGPWLIPHFRALGGCRVQLISFQGPTKLSMTFGLRALQMPRAMSHVLMSFSLPMF